MILKCEPTDPLGIGISGYDVADYLGADGNVITDVPTSIDAAAWFTARYAHLKLTSPPLADILARLERCRSAECDKLQNDVCTASGRNACAQRSHWFNMLAGGAVCQHWKPLLQAISTTPH